MLQGLVKPDIVFFGEDLPQRFHTLQLPDFAKCDLLIIMGTSLEVGMYGNKLNAVKVADMFSKNPAALWTTYSGETTFIIA